MNLDRRQFVSWSAGGALMLGLGVVPARAAADQALTPWISIHPDGKVTLYSTVSEMGQGARTGQRAGQTKAALLALVVASAAHADDAAIDIDAIDVVNLLGQRLH